MAALRRQRRNFKPREITFVPAASPRDLLERAGDEAAIYTVGAAPGVEDLRTMAAADLPPGWVAEGHYLTLPAPVLHYRRDDGRRLEVHRAASYFGEGDYTPTTAFIAFRLLAALVRGAFDEGQLLATPASTGRYLLARTIPPGREWPVLDHETQAFIRATTGQGRIEMFGRVGAAPELVQYDARLAYGAHCANLPAGEPTRDTRDAYAGAFTAARYLVRAAVPRDWDAACTCGAPGHVGIGLLPVRDADRWRWPARPGEPVGPTWVTNTELAIAMEHGWSAVILERMIFPGPPYPAIARRNGQQSKRGPLDAWAAKLIAIRQNVADERVPDVAALMRAGIRAILLFGIGSLHGAPRKVTRTITADQARAGEIPAHARDVLPLGDRFVWTETEQTRWPEMSHPEWTAALWARARCALLATVGASRERVGMLHVPASTVVGCFTDSLYLAHDPQWADDGNVGRYRRQWNSGRPVDLPATAAELRRLKAHA